MEETHCINCNSIVSTAFCPNCGQKNEKKRITLLSLYHDFQSRIYGFDGMFPRTVKDLTLRPGKVAIEFIRGNRVKYVGPVGYFFLMITVFILFLGVLGIDFSEYAAGNSPIDVNSSNKEQLVANHFFALISQNLRIFFFLIVPITGLWARLFFRKSGMNWLENTVPVFYSQGHLEWLTILNAALFHFFGFSLNFFEMVFRLPFYAYACTDVYTSNRKWVVFLKGLLVITIAYLTFMILMGILGIIYIRFDPEIMKALKEGN